MQKPTIGFIGAGNMALSLIGGILEQNAGYKVIACDPSLEQLDRIKTSFDRPEELSTSQDNSAVEEADVIVLAVKPQILKSVAESIQAHIKAGGLVISLAPGITIDSLQTWVGQVAIVRCMPNTPSLIHRGAAGLFANPMVSEEQKRLTEQLFSAVGISCWVPDESQIDLVTAVSGSGPAYFFLFTQYLAEVAQEMGLEKSLAEKLSRQTLLGAGELASRSLQDLAELRRNVTSPGGTTEAAIKRFQSDDLKTVVKNAMVDCAARADEMSKEFGE